MCGWATDFSIVSWGQTWLGHLNWTIAFQADTIVTLEKEKKETDKKRTHHSPMAKRLFFVANGQFTWPYKFVSKWIDVFLFVLTGRRGKKRTKEIYHFPFHYKWEEKMRFKREMLYTRGCDRSVSESCFRKEKTHHHFQSMLRKDENTFST